MADNTKPLDQENRDKLKALMQTSSGRKTAATWGMDRGTLAEAAMGMPKRAATRYMIEGKLKDAKIP